MNKLDTIKDVVKNQFHVISMAKESIMPTAKKVKVSDGGKALLWGKKMEYGRWLRDLYTHIGSGIHKQIIDKKVRYIAGRGFERDINNVELNAVLDSNKLDKELLHAAENFELFNAFAFRVSYNIGKTQMFIKSLDIDKIAFGEVDPDSEIEEFRVPHFWYCLDWTDTKKYEPEYYPLYDKDALTPSIYYYSYRFNTKKMEYPIPMYANVLVPIQSDTKVFDYYDELIENGFNGTYQLNFPTGIPSDEQMEENEEAFHERYVGKGKDNVIITYTEPDQPQPQLTPVPSTASDEKFGKVLDMAEDRIVKCHQMPYALLIAQAGKLGGTEEREQLINEFINDYIEPRILELQDVIQELTHNFGISEKPVIIRPQIQINSVTK